MPIINLKWYHKTTKHYLDVQFILSRFFNCKIKSIHWKNDQETLIKLNHLLKIFINLIWIISILFQINPWTFKTWINMKRENLGILHMLENLAIKSCLMAYGSAELFVCSLFQRKLETDDEGCFGNRFFLNWEIFLRPKLLHWLIFFLTQIVLDLKNDW